MPPPNPSKIKQGGQSLILSHSCLDPYPFARTSSFCFLLHMKLKCLDFHNKLCWFFSEENAKNDLKKLPVIPTYILREHPSIQYW